MAIERLIADNPYTVRAALEPAFEGDFGQLTTGASFRLIPRLLIAAFLIGTAFLLGRQLGKERPTLGLRARNVGLLLAAVYGLAFITPIGAGIASSPAWVWVVGFAWALVSAGILALDYRKRPSTGEDSKPPRHEQWLLANGGLWLAAQFILAFAPLPIAFMSRVNLNHQQLADWRAKAVAATLAGTTMREEILSAENKRMPLPEFGKWATQKGAELQALKESSDRLPLPPSKWQYGSSLSDSLNRMGEAANRAAVLGGTSTAYSSGEGEVGEGADWQELLSNIDSSLAEVSGRLESPTEISPFAPLAGPLTDIEGRVETDRLTSTAAAQFIDDFDSWQRDYDQARLDFQSLMNEIRESPATDINRFSDFQSQYRRRQDIQSRLDRLNTPADFYPVVDIYRGTSSDGMRMIDIYYRWYTSRNNPYIDSAAILSEGRELSRNIFSRLEQAQKKYVVLKSRAAFKLDKYRLSPPGK